MAKEGNTTMEFAHEELSSTFAYNWIIYRRMKSPHGRLIAMARTSLKATVGNTPLTIQIVITTGIVTTSRTTTEAIVDTVIAADSKAETNLRSIMSPATQALTLYFSGWILILPKQMSVPFTCPLRSCSIQTAPIASKLCADTGVRC